jgi:hypothetical protein
MTGEILDNERERYGVDGCGVSDEFHSPESID